MELPFTEENASPRRHNLPTKKPSAKCGMPPLKLLIRSVLETPYATQATVIDFGYPQELDGKVLPLKFLHSLHIGHQEIKAVLTMKLPLFMVLEGAM